MGTAAILPALRLLRNKFLGEKTVTMDFPSEFGREGLVGGPQRGETIRPIFSVCRQNPANLEPAGIGAIDPVLLKDHGAVSPGEETSPQQPAGVV